MPKPHLRQARGARAIPLTIELLYFDGCPSYEQLLPSVKQLAAQTGATLKVLRVESVEAAEQERFLGSPTVRVDGIDVDPNAHERTDFGLKCRIYRSASGPSPLPPESWIRAALEGRDRLNAP